MTSLSKRENYQYPAPKLILLRGVWIVKVSIPAHMRHLFGNGSGTTRDRRKSTKTKDFKIAKSREYELAKIIYDDFDEKLQLQSKKLNQLTDEFASKAITKFAQLFKYKSIPDLEPNTEYKRLEDLKFACDVYADMIFNDASEDQVIKLFEAVFSNLKPEEIIMESRKFYSKTTFTFEQFACAGRYKTTIIHSFWQDLLIMAARHQGLPEPSAEPFRGGNVKFGTVNDLILPSTPMIKNMAEDLYGQPMREIDRPFRVIPQTVTTISSVMQDYLTDMRMKQKNIGTQRKLKRWIEQFHRIMGDLVISEIKPKHGYDYIWTVLTDHPN